MSGQNTFVLGCAIPTEARSAFGRLRNSGRGVEFALFAKEDHPANRSENSKNDFSSRRWSSLPVGSAFTAKNAVPVPLWVSSAGPGPQANHPVRSLTAENVKSARHRLVIR